MAGRWMFVRWAAGLAFVMALAGCQAPSDGGGSGGTTIPLPVFPGLKINLAIASVSIDSPPVVEFQVTDELGVGVPLLQASLDSGALSFGLAKLVPGISNNADSWQSYINKTEVATSNVGPGGNPVLASAMQATTEHGGILTNLGGGMHRYQFATDVANPAQTMGVTYDPSLTHRLVIEAQFTGANGQPIAANAHFDFVPDGGPMTRTKLVATTRSCNECHLSGLSAHGGRSVEVETCVACHNPGTTDANSGNNLDMVVMVHKIHMGEDLTNGYVVWGDGDEKEDFSDLPYPQDHRNCVKCHDSADAETPDADSWKTRPTQQACGACHDDLDFPTHKFGFPPGDNTICAGCHVSSISLDPQIIQTAHAMPDAMAAGWFKYNILGVAQTRPGQQPQLTFEVIDPRDGTRYDILNDPEFKPHKDKDDNDVAPRLAALFGWDTEDYHNTDSGATTGSPTTFPAPGQPVSVNALTSAVDTGGHVFMVQSPVAVPGSVRGTGAAAIEGHPVAIVDPDHYPGAYATVPVDNVFAYFPVTDLVLEPRRAIVSLQKCNSCHENLSLHGGNRQGAIEVCVICHNPYATDIAQRPATIDGQPDGVFDNFAATDVDGKREQPIHFRNLIHAIHAGQADKRGFRQVGVMVRGFGRSLHDYTAVGFPGVLGNCQTCHDPGTYEVPTPIGALGTTVRTANPALAGNQAGATAALANPADDLKISPMASACSSCHDSAQAQQHIVQTGGGTFSATQAVINGTVLEACGGCHGPGEIEDVTRVHAIQPLP